MKKIHRSLLLIVAFAINISNAGALEIFKDGKPADIPKATIFGENITLGGYPIFKGDVGWRFQKASSSMSGAYGSAESINRGFAVFDQVEPNGDWFSVMQVGVNLSTTGQNQYLTGSPCGGTHVVAVNKGRGKDDNCLTIDARSYQAGTANRTSFVVVVTQSRSGGRAYMISMDINTELLGFRETSPGDWYADSLQSSPSRKSFVERFQKWAELLQDGAARALELSQPQDAFDNIPSYRTLLPVPSDLSDGSFTQQFIGAVESTKHKEKFRAIAYTKIGAQRVKWANEYKMDDQATANKAALETCERNRPIASLPCKLYDLDRVVEMVTLPAEGPAIVRR